MLISFRREKGHVIDAHCHIEQDDYDGDREQVIAECKNELRAIVCSATQSKHFSKALEIAKAHEGFVFFAFGIHPEYVKDVAAEDIADFKEFVKANKRHVVAIGEVGLDYHWVTESKWQEKQRTLFREMIRFAKHENLPLVIHCRDAIQDLLAILEDERAERVLLHMFGSHNDVERVVKNGWNISCNYIISRSKTYRKVAKKCPMENLMLETDSPWLSFTDERNTPLTIKKVAEKIAEEKGIGFDEVWKACGQNASKFFGLNGIC